MQRAHQRPVVVPLAGTWIETEKALAEKAKDTVVPLAGTWIETHENAIITSGGVVVPLAGTWIETSTYSGTISPT